MTDSRRSRGRVGVCVVHWRSPESLLDTVDGLLRSSGVDIDVVVVDNASESAELALIDGGIRPPVHVVKLDTNRGFAGGANVGLRLLSAALPPGTYLAVCAHDTRVVPETLQRLAAALDANERLGIVGPTFGSVSAHSTHHYAHEPHAISAGSSSADVLASDWLPGALLVFRPEVLDQLGLFDERYFAYHEDIDICLRAWRGGWYVAGVKGALAAERGRRISTPGYVYLNTRNMLLLARWHRGRVAFAELAAWKAVHAAKAGVASIAPWRSAERRAISRVFARFQYEAVIDAVRGKCGPPKARLLA